MADFDAMRVLDALADAVVAADASQRIVYANRHVGRLLGWTPGDLVGRSLSDLFPPPHKEVSLDQAILLEARRADGSSREVELTLSESDGDGLLVATLRESRAYIEPEESATKLRAILETISVGVLLAEGPDGRLTISNPAANRIAGEPITASSYAEFVEKFPLEKLDGRRMGLADRPLSITMETNEPVRQTLKFRRKDGREFVLEVTTAPFPGPDGGAVTTFADVTERYALEQDSADRTAQFRALIDHLPVGVAYFDKMAVCRAGEWTRRGDFSAVIARNDVAGVTLRRNCSRRQLGGPRSVGDLRSRQRIPVTLPRIAWPDAVATRGANRYPRLAVRAAQPRSGHVPRGALALIMDVTERARTEAELKRAMEASEDASRRKTQFLSAVSHDLRTPVNALSLQAELLARIVEMRDDPEGELHLLAGDIRAVAANLIELINDLLDLTRFDSGAVDYHPSDFPLDDWLTSTLAPLELTARSRNLEFSWDVDRPGRIVRGDRVKLGRVLVNLVGNAIKFTEEGEVAVTAGADALGRFRMEVRDTGAGIPADQIDRIFDEFAQLRNPERDRTKGTGLGLAICRRLVEGVGGELTVASEPGRGSTFAAIYPPDHLADSPGPAPAPPEAGDRTSASEGASVLIVEDDPNSRLALARLLEHSGYAVATAGSGGEALALAAASPPTVILLDLMLPGMDGVAVLRAIRARGDAGQARVIVLTGDVTDSRREELAALRVDAQLPKPVDLPELLALLRRLAPGQASPVVA